VELTVADYYLSISLTPQPESDLLTGHNNWLFATRQLWRGAQCETVALTTYLTIIRQGGQEYCPPERSLRGGLVETL
jgi:hypothetical protein